MDNEQQVSSSENNSPRNKITPLLLVVVLLVVLGGVYFYQSQKSKQHVMGVETSSTPKRKMNPAMMKATTPEELTDQQKQELEAGISTATTQKTFTFAAGNFWFTPNNITVNKGDTVTFTFTPKDGFHDIVVDEFKAKAGPVIAGKTASVTFTADKAGTFEFYCDIDHHRQKGQKGTLIVQ